MQHVIKMRNTSPFQVIITDFQIISLRTQKRENFMKLLVCISKVPDTTTKIVFTENNTKFNEAGVQFIINPYDECTHW